MLGLEYSAVNAKIRFWFSQLLTEEDVQLLIDSSLNDTIEFIRQREIKLKIDTHDISEVEGAIKQAIVNYIKSATRYLGGQTSAFLHEWLRAYEIENLKMIARAVIGGKQVDFLYQVTSKQKFSKQAVMEITSLEEFKDFLRGTEYYKLAIDTLPRVQEESNTFYWEMILDNFYGQKLKDASNHLSGNDKTAVTDLLFLSLEMNRLSWIFRLRFHYHLSVEETVSYIPNIYEVITKRKYLNLLHSSSPEEFFQQLKNWNLILHSVSDLGEMQLEMNKMILEKTRRFRARSPFSIGLLVSFIILKSMNVHTFILLLEGKRHKIEKDYLRQMLVY